MIPVNQLATAKLPCINAMIGLDPQKTPKPINAVQEISAEYKVSRLNFLLTSSSLKLVLREITKKTAKNPERTVPI